MGFNDLVFSRQSLQITELSQQNQKWHLVDQEDLAFMTPTLTWARATTNQLSTAWTRSTRPAAELHLSWNSEYFGEKCGNFGATAIFEYYWDGTSINRFSFTLNFVNLVQRLLMICIGKYFELMVVDVGPTCEFTLWISQSMILLVFWTSHQVSRNSGNSNIF